MNTPCGGYIGVDQNHLQVHFDSAATVIFDVPISELEAAVKLGEPVQLGGFTLRHTTWVEPATFLWIKYVRKTPMIRVQLHSSLNGKDLMVVKREDLLRAIRDVC